MYGRDLIRHVASVLLVICALVFGARGQDHNGRSNLKKVNAVAFQSRGNPTAVLRAIIGAGRLEDLRWPNFSGYRGHVDDFYRRSDYSLAWIGKGRPTPQGLEMIEILQQADLQGLHAEDYDSSRWPERLARLRGEHSLSDTARFDVALTVCTMRYVSDLRVGRINPRHSKFRLNVGPKKLDLPAFVVNLASGTDLKAELATIEPPVASYREMKKALLTYTRLAKEDTGESLPIPRGIAFSGTLYDGTPRLATFLRLVGDLPESAVVPDDPRLYDGALVDAVKRFQERHGLRPAGYLNLETIEQLNVPLNNRVEQIRLALERYRWLSYDFPRPPIVVNIPAFRLYAFNEEGGIGLTMSVDVGGEDSASTRTPVLEDALEYVVFRPYWDVPLDIQRTEIVPNIKEDPNYLSEVHFEVIAPGGQVVTDGKVTKEVLQQLSAGKLRVRQKPGADNSLGLVKFIFPNRYNVYLHDTPSWENYFAQPDRHVSHGCVHLEKPDELAAWVLRDKPEWTLERVRHAMRNGQDAVKVNLTKPIPVLILYTTALALEHGGIHFYPDIYGYDDDLQEALSKGSPYPSLRASVP
jgi:L,D-transpeptidase YcbB